MVSDPVFRCVKNASFVGMVAAFALVASAAAVASPNAVIEDSMAVLTEKLDGRKAELAADRKSLYALIDEILLPRFDRKFAAQLVLARHWRSASEAQRSRFIEAFYQALLRRYADGILEFDPNKIKILPFRGDVSKPRSKVRSTVALEDGSSVAVDYDLVKRESGWLVYNVVIEGVSYVTNFRAELDAEIRSTSLDAVIARLEEEAGMSADE
ncbi:MAG: ABC transporter substrate-binding protein [Gammaproteobacteria bacterium]|nr:ABC transporter substrate-binding protein [Gammaproteobacteria bacterium]MDH3482034.1 ABC transporter substrate-binding protein [Gammaproteobacteria bacterium]